MKGKKEGIWTTWSETGQKTADASFKDGLKDGNWFVWDENGVKRYEMFYEKGQKTVVVEDLVSTGKSSLQVVDVLKAQGMEVIGMVSIFTYGFPAATEAFEAASLPYQSLTDYPSLIELAVKKGIVSPEQEEVLLKWRESPSTWTGNL